jgi:hypothetical protein
VSGAFDAAARDLADWHRLLERAEAVLPDVREVTVTGFDSSEDLNRRGRWWSHRFPSDRLPDVLAFGVALAAAEGGAWKSNDPVVATRAFEDRRFLLSDRLIHWVVPVTYVTKGAESIRDGLLALGDRLRVAPLLTGDEGIHPPGEDSYGPRGTALRIELGPPERWIGLQESHPGSARLWRDLALRACR